jgi:hypothetical protein
MDDINLMMHQLCGDSLRKVRDRGDQSMQMARSVRTFICFGMLGFAGLLPGCSGGQGSSPVTKEARKNTAEEVKASHQEQKAERAKAKETMREVGKARGPG